MVAALHAEPERRGVLYGFGFIGSGIGSVLALACLWWLVPTNALAVPATLAAIGVASVAIGSSMMWRALALVPLLLSGAAMVAPPWQIVVTSYKGLPQVENFPDARRTVERFNPAGWMVAVEADAFHYAPGLSLAYSGTLPEQTAIFVDGDVAGAVTRSSHVDSTVGWLPAAVAYVAVRPRRVLVLGAGGDTEVRTAVHHGATDVRAVDLHPGLIEVTSRHANRYSESVQWLVGDPRDHIERSKDSFDLIVLPPVGGLGSAAAGTQGLNEDFLHTVEAYTAMLDRLSDGGILSVTRWIDVPPRASLRAILTVALALREAGYPDVARSLFVIRGWATVTILARPSGFDRTVTQEIRRWVGSRRFDVDWGIDAPDTAQALHRLDDTSIRDAATAAAAGPSGATRFAQRYLFDVSPRRDARPYPHQFAGISAVRTIMSAERGAWLPVADWGYIALVATLAQSLLLGGLALILPVLVMKRLSNGITSSAIYFGAIGLAYMSAEIAAIQQLRLLVGHPVYAVTLVLVVFLLSSGAGSIYTDRDGVGHRWRPTSVLVPAFLGYGVLLLPAIHVAQSFPLTARVGFAVLVLAPVAFTMGRPFPEGLHIFARRRETGVALAWAANGFASVVAAPLAALIALELGSSALYFLAASAYAVATVAGRLGESAGVG
jgi:hypothetical protein